MTFDRLINLFREDYILNPKYRNDEREIIEKYGRIFSFDKIDELKLEDFSNFLDFSENKHWDGLQRNKKILISNFSQIKEGLKILLDESRDLVERLNILINKDSNYIKGMNKGTLTPILHVVFPKKYGVYNNKTINAMNELGFLNQDFRKAKSFGEKYKILNDILLEKSNLFNLTLWQLDYFWHYYLVEYKGFNDFFRPLIANDAEENYENKTIEVNILRRIRETIMVSELKKKYDYRCQICGKRIKLYINGEDRFYVEGHHLQPLSQKHKGPDTKENIIILCPNHHVEFDYDNMAIDPKDNTTILHKNQNNDFHNKKIQLKHKISSEFIKYHYKIFSGADFTR